jgi:hypothetical protein
MRVLAALVALLLVAGCGGDPHPKEPKSSATASATPTITAPTMPAQAKEDTPSGAANFVDYFVRAFNYAAQTGDGQPMLAVAAKCKPCRQYAADFEKLKTDNKLASEPVWSLSDVSVGTSRNPIEVSAKVEVVGEDKAHPSALTFELNQKAPFEMRDIRFQDD